MVRVRLGSGLIQGFEVQTLQGITGRSCGAMKERQGTIGVAVEPHFGLDVLAPVAIRGYLRGQSFEANAVALADGAHVLFAEDVIQTGVDEWREGAAFTAAETLNSRLKVGR